MWTFLTIWTVNQDIKSKIIFLDKNGQNILRLFVVLPNLPFIISKTRRDY